MPRKAAAPLGGEIVQVAKGAARPLGSKAGAASKEPRIGITVRFRESVHEQLRVLAFERRTSKQAIIEELVAHHLSEGKAVAR